MSLGLVLALASAACYGANVVAARVAGDAGISGVSLVLYRIAPMLVVAGLLAARGGFSVPKPERGAVAWLGLATVGVGTAYFSAIAFVPVTVAVAVFYTYPALIVLLDPLAGGAPLRPARLGIVALAVAGVALVVGPAWDDLDPRGLALAGLASLATAVQFLVAARCPATPVGAKTVWVHLVLLPAVAGIALASGTLNVPAALLAAPVAVGLTMAGYVAGFLLQMAALARAPAAAAGIAFCFEPVVAAATAALALGERPGPLQLVGGALVLAAVAANAREARPARVAEALT
jgi:drug/metabolite transporter (DMT)-like permease